MAGHGVPAVDAFGDLLSKMLERARSTKKTDTVEPPLNKADLVDLFEQFDSTFPPSSSPEVKKRSQYAVIETAVRLKFNHLLVSLAPIR
jgi:THO complex subunit 1